MKPILVRGGSLKEFFFAPEGCFITEVWNTADDEGLSIARARVSPGATTTPHFLDGVTERYLIVQGKGRMEAGVLEGVEVNAGDLVIFPDKNPQSITNTGEDDLIFYAICTPRFKPGSYRGL